MNNKGKRRTMMIIISLVVIGLGVGFAAFTTSLTINSTATITPNASTFKVVFSNKIDSVDTSNVTPTLTPTTLSAEQGVIDNTTNPTITNLYVNFTEPGQKAVYKFYVYNAGEYTAYLNSITYKGNKTCTPESGTTAELVNAACEDIKVTTKVGDLSVTGTTQNITGNELDPKEGKEVTVTIEYASNGDRADGPFNVEFNDISLFYGTITGQNEEYAGESGSSYTGNIYTYVGASSNISIENPWCLVVPGMLNSCQENDYINVAFGSEQECQMALQQYGSDPAFGQLAAVATCEQGSIEYETTANNLDKVAYLKHYVENNIITTSYACTTYIENGISKEVCLRGGESYYESNKATLRGVESYINTLSHGDGKGVCYFDDSDSNCEADHLEMVTYSSGNAQITNNALDDSYFWACIVYSNGSSACAKD